MPNRDASKAYELTRREFLRTAVVAGGGAVLAACQPPRGAPTASAPPSQRAAWEQQWDDLIAAAKREGTLVFAGPPTPAVREQMPAAFRTAFGVEIEYIGGPTGDLMTRIEAERAAGQYTLDALITGASSLYTRAYPQRMLAPLGDMLFHPDAVDPTKWSVGRPWFSDPEGKYILRLANNISSVVSTNEQHVKIADLKSWKDLLDPKYRGRISAFDPTVAGTGNNMAAFLLRNFGEDYLRALYRDQQVALSRQERQLADWLGRGQYPLSIGLNSAEIEPLKRDGFPVAAVGGLPDAPGVVTAGFGQLAVLEPSPHPNAAKLFANWMAMKEGNEVFNRAQSNGSVRTDVVSSWLPDYSLPKPGVTYFDTYDWDSFHELRNPEVQERIRQLTAQAS